MGIKCALFQSFYMDSNEVIDAEKRIRSVMAAVDGCMEEADGSFCRISAQAESVPVKYTRIENEILKMEDLMVV